ncbi:potassium channel family protein [Altericroceibacterium xinjiangense]|uniref:potassium channel family protein n=1 Tax=Altericroceibacterium xinjiangense TaxID=762261 RepID=UPI000F7DB19A|nr:potassium channel family protein [Altericroceibacterium xinjiangense]
MPIVQTALQRLYVAIATLSWGVLAAAFLAHMALSWLLLRLAGETDLTSEWLTFGYFYMTTATTVGYGDLSPSLPGGRLAAILVILPGAIALFTAFLGKAVSDIGGFWRRRLQGQGNFSRRLGHTLIVGWRENHTRQLIEGLQSDGAGHERIVLLAPGLDSNPLPDTVDFVGAQSLSDFDSFSRAGAAGATTVVVRGASDDETLAATLAARAAAPKAHVVAFFQDEGAARLIRNQLPDVEVITSIATQLMVRSARDPGASRLAELMFCHDTQDTAFSLKVPDLAGELTYFGLLCGLKQRHDLTLIGLCREDDGEIDLNCPPDRRVRTGDTVFYIADHRIGAGMIDWAACQGVPA